MKAVYMPLIRKEVHHFARIWNNHKIRKQQDRPNSVAGQPFMLFHYPREATNFGKQPNLATLTQLHEDVAELGRTQINLTNHRIQDLPGFIKDDLLSEIERGANFASDLAMPIYIAYDWTDRQGPIALANSAKNAKDVEELMRYLKPSVNGAIPLFLILEKLDTRSVESYDNSIDPSDVKTPQKEKKKGRKKDPIIKKEPSEQRLKLTVKVSKVFKF
ncbi:MAG: hypothetical protein M4579_007078 [Chaenotheca gracillima]|nr:MAG: hypothetical protein M4579_007078 [Chaenotheca gracillima]